MSNLVAQGPQPEQRWSRALTAGMQQLIGREIGWATPWDDRISRKHVEVTYRDERLEVRAVRGAKNPVYFQGVANDSFSLAAGEHFVVGRTTFILVDDQVAIKSDVPQPLHEKKFATEELRGRAFRDPERRLEQLSRLPALMENATTDLELRTRLLAMVLAGIGRAAAVAVVTVKTAPSPVDTLSDSELKSLATPPPVAGQAARGPLEILNCDLRDAYQRDFPISERLALETFQSGASVVHVWGQRPGARPTDSSAGMEWAFCVPWAGRGPQRRALYVAGVFSNQTPQDSHGVESLSDDLKFAQILVSFASALLDLQRLKGRQVILDRFLSPRVRDALEQTDLHERLAAREIDAAVMFCDLRGFSSAAERASGGIELQRLAQQIGRSLEIMTSAIIEQDGVVSDFQGDAAMGFWGWPSAQPDAVWRACQAALAIRSQMTVPAVSTGAEAVQFKAGVGIASGRALAGIIGPLSQGKIGVLGPVVNLAARLETMTKQLKAPVLIDPVTARLVIEHQEQSQTGRSAGIRVRRIAKVRPAGLKQPLDVFELLPPDDLPGELSDEQIARFDAALADFERGMWKQAGDGFAGLVQQDPVARYLLSLITQAGETPPEQWQGVIVLDRK